MAKLENLTMEHQAKRELAMARAAEAPVIFFEEAGTFGARNHVCMITLDMGQHISVDGALMSSRRTVAHLRFPAATIPSLRAALDKIEEQMRPVPAGLKN